MSTPPPPPPGNQPPFPPQPPFGGPPPGYAPYGQPAASQPARLSGMAVAGFVLSLVGAIPCFWFWFLQVPGYLGTIFSIIGLKQTKDGARRGRGMAIAGLVIGLVLIAIAIGLAVFVYTSDDCIVDGISFECDLDN